MEIGGQFKDFKPIYHGDQGVMLSHNEMRRTLVKPPDEQRYPRGFTPERMGEVKGALMGTNSAGDPWPWVHTYGSKIDTGEEVHPMAGPRGNALALEAVARSTAPMSEITHPDSETSVIVAGREHWKDKTASDSTPSGSYRNPRQIGPGKKTASIHLYARESAEAMHERFRTEGGYSKEEYPYEGGGGGKGSMLREHRNQLEDTEMTLLHELGHHASALAGTNKYHNPAERGAEEARADDFAAKHHVQDPRTARRQNVDTRGWDSYEGTQGEKGHPQDPYARPGAEDMDNAQFEGAYKAQRSVRIPRPPSAEEQVEADRETQYQKQSQALFRTGKQYGSYDTPEFHYMEPREQNFPPKEHARYPESQDLADKKTPLNPNVNARQHTAGVTSGGQPIARRTRTLPPS